MAEDRGFSYFFLGLGIGIGIGILFAPKSGEETRTYLKTKADEGRDFVKKRSSELVDSAEDLVERSKSAVARQRDNVAAAIDAGRAAYRNAVEDPGSPTPPTGA